MMIGYCRERQILAACSFRKTRIFSAKERGEGGDFSGVIYAHQLRVTIGQMVEDLDLIAAELLRKSGLERSCFADQVIRCSPGVASPVTSERIASIDRVR